MEEPPTPPTGLPYKVGLGEGCSSGADDDGGAPRGPRPAVAPRLGKRTLRPALGALRELPVGTMRARELPLVLLALVLCQAPRAPAAPVPAAGETVLAKMYPRGNHWAVGECPARASPGQDPSALGAVSPLPAFLGPGFGDWVCSDLSTQTPALSPQTPHPSPSWQAVRPSAAKGWPLGLPSSPGYPGQRAALQSTQRHAKITFPPHLPNTSFLQHHLSLNNFRKPGPRERLGPLVQPSVYLGCAFAPGKAPGGGL